MQVKFVKTIHQQIRQKYSSKILVKKIVKIIRQYILNNAKSAYSDKSWQKKWPQSQFLETQLVRQADGEL